MPLGRECGSLDLRIPKGPEVGRGIIKTRQQVRRPRDVGVRHLDEPERLEASSRVLQRLDAETCHPGEAIELGMAPERGEQIPAVIAERVRSECIVGQPCANRCVSHILRGGVLNVGGPAERVATGPAVPVVGVPPEPPEPNEGVAVGPDLLEALAGDLGPFPQGESEPNAAGPITDAEGRLERATDRRATIDPPRQGVGRRLELEQAQASRSADTDW